LRKQIWRIKHAAKEILRVLYYGSGTAFLRATLFPNYKAVVLCYHTVGDNLPLYPENAVKPAEFTRQMAYLRRKKKVVPLKKLIEGIDNKTPRENLVSITLDDGYKSCLDLAVPEMIRLGLPATFFVSPGLMEKGHKWDDLLYLASSPFRKESLREKAPEVQTRDRKIAKDSPGELAKLKLSLMDYSDLHYLMDHGFEIGSHSLNHYYLSAQDEICQENEIVHSKRILEEKLSTSIGFFAYPFGHAGCSSDSTRTLVEKSHYWAAFDGDHGYVESGGEKLSLARMGVSRSTPFWKFKMMVAGVYW